MKKGETATPELLERMRLGREKAALEKAEREAQSVASSAEAVAVSGDQVTPAPALGDDPAPIATPDWFKPDVGTTEVQTPQPRAAVPTTALQTGLDLSPEEMERIAIEVAKKVAQETRIVQDQKRSAIVAKATELELQRQRRQAGLTDYRDDIMEILIDVAPFADRLTWDGKIYQHGHWYKVPRRVYDSMREAMARSWDAEERAGNPNRKFYRQATTGTTNPMIREMQTSDGSFTVYQETKVNARTGAIADAPPGSI